MIASGTMRPGHARLAAIVLSVMVASPRALAQGDEPRIGQKGKDVVWVPTPPELVEAEPRTPAR